MEDLTQLLAATRHPDVLGWGSEGSGESVVGESNQRLSFVLPALHAAFPKARYIWLMRDGRDAVASMHHRLWYHRREQQRRHPQLAEWVSNRVCADAVGEMSKRQWVQLDYFSKCCWYWGYVNRLIAQQVAALDLNVMQVRLDQLAARSESILDFVGLSGAVAPEVPHVNSSQAARHWWRNPLPWQRWSSRQQRSFTEFAADVMSWHDSTWSFDELESLGRRTRSCVYRGAKAMMATAVRPVAALKRAELPASNPLRSFLCR